MYKLCLFLIIFLFSACHNPTPTTRENLAQLLDNKVLSEDIYNYANVLKKEYELVSPPAYHNFLVNIGVKKRGLCWHFTYDLLAHLKEKNFEGFDYYIVGANINEYWSEHNALLITCQGCVVQKGVIIDLWRNSGDVFFTPFGKDSAYEWSVRGGKR